MNILHDPTTLGEFLKQDAAARHSEKAITQVTTAELGLHKTADEANRVSGLSGAADSVRISTAAAGRYRMLAGDKTADDQNEQTAGNDSPDRAAHDIGKTNREAAQALIASAGEGEREPEQTGAAQNTRNRDRSEPDDTASSPDAPDASPAMDAEFQLIRETA